MPNLTLTLLPQLYAVCKLHPDKYIPSWALVGDFVSLTHTDQELSVVCPQENVPPEAKAERGWHCLKVIGEFDFALAGIHASLAIPLAEANISILGIATYSTDYILIKEEYLQDALNVLSAAGHTIQR
jgi:uncharacterized protein